MSKCPFWSTNKHKVSCSAECPMFSNDESGEQCIFIENCTDTKLEMKEINNYDYDESYTKDDTLVLSYIKESASY